MPSGNTTIRSRVNPSKFMGAAHAAGASLEERVENNERKITLIKNIINYKDSLLPIPNPEDSESDNLSIAGRLDNIGEALGVIGGLFKLQLSSLQDKEEKDRQDEAEQDKKARESELEAGKKATKKKKDGGLKLPGLGILGNLQRFFTNIALGAASIKVLDWLKDPVNQAKVGKVADWLKNNAGAIFKGLFVIAGIDLATRVLSVAMGVSKVLSWLGLLPLAIGALLFSLGRIGSKRLPKHAQQVVKELESMEGGVTAENRQELLEKVKLELAMKRETRKNLLPAIGIPFSGVHPKLIDLQNEIVVLKKMEKFLETGVHSKLPKQEAGGLPGQGTDVKINWEDMYADGGRPPVGKVVSVGERGRELFVADTSGTVISNDKTEHVFDGGAILVAKSSALEKISNTSSSISQKVNNRHGSSKIIDLRGGQQGSTPTAGNITTGNQIEGVSSVFLDDLLVKAAQVQLGVVG